MRVGCDDLSSTFGCSTADGDQLVDELLGEGVGAAGGAMCELFETGANTEEKGDGEPGVECDEGIGHHPEGRFKVCVTGYGREDGVLVALPGFAALALGNILKDDDGATRDPVAQDGGARVGDGKAGAVFPPEHFAITAVDSAVAEGHVNGTLFAGIDGAVGVGVMDDKVLRLADELFCGPANHGFGSRIRKGRETFRI